MKSFFIILSVFVFFSSCKNKPELLVDKVFIDSLLTNNVSSTHEKINAADVIFWENRLEKAPKSYVDAQKYAGTLSSRFHLYGNIHDILKADSIMQWLNKEYQEKDAGVFRTLASIDTQRHRFLEANTYFQKALNIGSDKYQSELMRLDVAMELGHYDFVKNELKRLKNSNDYGYFFRLSKHQHFEGKLDSAIISMQKAVELAGTNNFLKQAALSNTGDLYLHSGELNKAVLNYKQSIRLDAADYHSLAGLGWIALVHDKKDTIAEKIFEFIQSKTKSPDMLLKISQVYEQRKDLLSQKKYAQKFADEATKSVYGDMYNKYLIDLYDGVLDNPPKMLAIAEKEIKNRETPQTYAWYAWALFKNNQPVKAFEIYENYVSEKPLEGLELYYMGKMMKASKKEFNAKNYFEAAYKNRYDLSPKKIEELSI